MCFVLGVAQVRCLCASGGWGWGVVCLPTSFSFPQAKLTGLFGLAPLSATIMANRGDSYGAPSTPRLPCPVPTHMQRVICTQGSPSESYRIKGLSKGPWKPSEASQAVLGATSVGGAQHLQPGPGPPHEVGWGRQRKVQSIHQAHPILGQCAPMVLR